MEDLQLRPTERQATGCDEVALTLTGTAAILELRRPHKRNAVSVEMLDAITHALQECADRDDVRALVIRGAGPAFCAGADLSTVKGADGEVSAVVHDALVRALDAIRSFPVPSIARIHGACIGGGCALALACDMRLAHPDATFAIPAVRYGIVYEAPSVQRMTQLMGPSRAARFLYTAELITGRQAEALGLVDECTQDLAGSVARLVEQIALGDRTTMIATRQLIF